LTLGVAFGGGAGTSGAAGAGADIAVAAFWPSLSYFSAMKDNDLSSLSAATFIAATISGGRRSVTVVVGCDFFMRILIS
jgi:hypothetical protein